MTQKVQPTATERRKAIGKVKVAAVRFVASEGAWRRAWADKLLDHIAACDLETVQTLMNEIKPSGCRWTPMKHHLQLVVAVSAWSPDVCLPAVAALAAMDVEALIPKRGRWPDPALANLVAAVAPVWKRVTGRSARPVSKDKEGDVKVHLFAQWLGGLIGKLGVTPPPPGRVADIARVVERDRKRLLGN
jgi:hypothetical protein